jgi:hypothetical protein
MFASDRFSVANAFQLFIVSFYMKTKVFGLKDHSIKNKVVHHKSIAEKFNRIASFLILVLTMSNKGNN